jgi:hypothetical protein
MDKVKWNNVNKWQSKVLDKLKEMKDKPSFDTILKKWEKWNILKFKSNKSYYIASFKDDKILAEGGYKFDTLIIDKDIYNSEVVSFIGLNYEHKSYNEVRSKFLLWILPIENEKITYKENNEIYNWKVINLIAEKFDEPKLLVETWEYIKEISVRDIKTLEWVSIDVYHKFFHSFWKIFESDLEVVCLPNKNSSFSESFIWATDSIKKDFDWKILISVKDQEENYFDVEVWEIEKLDWEDYTKLASDFNINYTDWTDDTFHSLEEVKEYIEKDLKWDLSTIRSVIECPQLNDLYLYERELDHINSLMFEHYQIKNINIESIDIDLYHEAENYEFVWYYDSKINKKYLETHEDNVEEIEYLFKNKSFYTQYKDFNIYYIIDPLNKQLILSEIWDYSFIAYDFDTLEDDIVWITVEGVKDIILNDIKNLVSRNELILKISNKYCLENDKDVNELRDILYEYNISQD